MSTSAWHPGGLVHTRAIAIGSSKHPGQRLCSFSGAQTNFSSVPPSLLAFEFPSSQGPRALHFLPSAAVLALALPLPARPEQPVRGVHERNGSWDSTPPSGPRRPCRCRSVPLEGQHAAAAPAAEPLIRWTLSCECCCWLVGCHFRC